MHKFLKKIHLFGTWKRIVYICVNHLFVGTNPQWFGTKRKLLQSIGYELGVGTKIVGPIYISGTIRIGTNCWIGKNFMVNGNGTVVIGDNCDIAPEVAFNTGGHQIGNHNHRAGIGEEHNISIGDGCWIGARATFANTIVVGNGSVVAACACVVQDVPADTLVGGVPAKIIRRLDDAVWQEPVKA